MHRTRAVVVSLLGLVLFVPCLAQVGEASIGPIIVPSAEELEGLKKERRCTNLEEVQRDIGFLNVNKNPYPKLWYDTEIDYNQNCYISFDSDDRSTYRLDNLAASEDAEALRQDGKFLTHFGPCGVCSQFQDLVVYLTTPDLTNPVRSCAMKVFKSQTVRCLQKLGFSKECAMIWYWNSANTRRTHAQGGCFGSCIIRIWSPNNEPRGKYNPCKPTKEVMDRQPSGGEDEAKAGSDQGQVERDLAEQAKPKQTVVVTEKGGVSSSTDYKDGQCGNTLNGKPICVEKQWRNGPYRLNPCLQCDECRSGPIFQKIAGRTRRASGIVSAISRDGVRPIAHNYGV